MAKSDLSKQPALYNSVAHSHSGVQLKWWAALFREGRLERQRGPFSTMDAAEAAFLPIKTWPKYTGPPEG